ncbi:MAG: response regulator transcription factor [Desulfurispora sp.]|uniref:response regulator transcription factor n=1 Tax=Desulfurispora sp. TaxID=3014275 RepID=UPI00404B6456
MSARILIVEDDPNIAELIGIYLKAEGYETHTAADGLKALEMYRRLGPDLLILDLNLPDLDGREVCRRIRAAGGGLPIIMLTARDSREDKIAGLDDGADDYVVKPFDPLELTARVRAHLRRAGAPAGAAGAAGTGPAVVPNRSGRCAGAEKPLAAHTPAIPPDRESGSAAVTPKPNGDTLANFLPAFNTQAVASAGDLVVDITTFTATCRGCPLELTRRELQLLHYLISHPEQVFSRDQLLDAVWGYDYAGETRTVDMHIRRLREKLAPHGADKFIKTVYGVGYKFSRR